MIRVNKHIPLGPLPGRAASGKETPEYNKGHNGSKDEHDKDEGYK